MKKISVVLATYNEEKNLSACLESVQKIAAEICIVDGSSTDKTVEIAKKFGARIEITENHANFHINKQKALDMAKQEWILQLDADEIVSAQLEDEIEKVIQMTPDEIEQYQQTISEKPLFKRHQELLEKRDGNIGTQTGHYAAFFLPRLNFFLGRYMKYGGVYPDGVIRLVRKNHAHFPCKNIHEQIVVSGRVGWLQYPLFHRDSPTFKRYLDRNSRYIDLIVDELKHKKDSKNIHTATQYLFILPVSWFLNTYIRHKGFLESWQGFVFSFFSSIRFPRAYMRFLQHE